MSDDVPQSDHDHVERPYIQPPIDDVTLPDKHLGEDVDGTFSPLLYAEGRLAALRASAPVEEPWGDGDPTWGVAGDLDETPLSRWRVEVAKRGESYATEVIQQRVRGEVTTEEMIEALVEGYTPTIYPPYPGDGVSIGGTGSAIGQALVEGWMTGAEAEQVRAAVAARPLSVAEEAFLRENGGLDHLPFTDEASVPHLREVREAMGADVADAEVSAFLTAERPELPRDGRSPMTYGRWLLMGGDPAVVIDAARRL